MTGSPAFVSRTDCPACGSSNLETRYRCRFDTPPVSDYLASCYGADAATLDGTYIAARCTACGTWFQGEVGNHAFLERLYADWVLDADPATDPTYAFDVTHPAQSRDGHEVMAAAAALRLPLSQLRTLDFGMGWASWARIAASLGAQSFGDDIAPGRMAFAAAHGVRPHEPGAIYHFINAEQVVEHLADPLASIQALAASLAPGGILKISVPSPYGLAATFAALATGNQPIRYDDIMPLQPLEHLNCFALFGLRALAKRTGLKFLRPPIAPAFAFLGHRGALNLRDPGRAAKELARPLYQRLNPRNNLVWLHKPA